ncbi:hypothetical protein DPMN_095572 [Dreissena polymorpha]|uniref:Uncharacterized protein n=1 Tax=Dreissena polymorpha TaxID=45954 RepID=A0A9D4R303_DREPO|nr:hypothetical protein DPMN_095572 [Dreissena polymorpha]
MHEHLLKRDEYEKEWIGGPVYLWGANTSPGSGTLAKIDFETTNGLWIKVHDRRKDQPFSQPGDSGAMVCATDSKKTTLYAVAMLVGKSEGSNDPSVPLPRKQVTYYAVLLNEAFQVLNNIYRSEFKLCSDDAGTM